MHKYDYQKLLKQRQQLSAKLNRIANKSNTDYLDLLRGVLVKKEYNRFAPKIIRAASLKELAEFEADMFTTVYIGNSRTKVIGGKMVTPRGYQVR